ncbi:Protease HtpX-like protein [Neochlamydia sp. AcF65]|uniref:protease HtpX n=1 Tax=Neochlamydia sp. AcF65 TaxID=2795735 RepID=UPI001BC8F0B6|nr:protease HtpX [Neochlamydia sp. AcF65]MBS4165864.1 Protease HtpX-like protein [Neochlamydia sp. AcF65]
MALAKRIILFLVVNFLVVAFISFITYFFNLQPFLMKKGINLPSLAIFCLLWGMGGAVISLLLSKVMAKWMVGLEMIDPDTPDLQKRAVLETVYQLAKKAGLPKMPEVGIYYSPELNAFATGPSRSNSLVAVSSGLIERMEKNEVDAVIGHEITHIANGDMVTMTLLQGVINAFVMFLARIVAYGISKTFSKERDEEPSPFMYQMIVFGLEIVFMILGSLVVASFSRYREYRADAGSARLVGASSMIAALQALKSNFEVKDPNQNQEAINAFKISGTKKGFMQWFASHPPLDDRIARLQQLYRF